MAADALVEPKMSVLLIEIADSLEAEDLRKYCEDMVIWNLDYIFTVSAQSAANASPDSLANLENLLEMKSSEPWSCRGLPNSYSNISRKDGIAYPSVRDSRANPS